MPDPLATLTPPNAWEALPAAQWDAAAARHLLLRLGFSATAEETARALKDGASATVHRVFNAMPVFPAPAKITQLAADAPQLADLMRGADTPEKRQLQQQIREQSREAGFDLVIQWLQLAARPENSAAEKWLLFLANVWVVSEEKVRNTALIYQHLDVLRRHAFGTAPELAKAVSRSPAMISYLDLQESRREAPNENFARELFELFTLGEGHYTEQDIKESARAFTGYRQKFGQFLYVPRQHDDGWKTVFGHRGEFNGDDIIELVFRQPAAGAYLPRLMVRYYLSDVPLPAELTDRLGTQWADAGYSLPFLLSTFFTSRAFFAAEYRDNFIKSPVQFYLGLLQDLGLDVPPLSHRVVGVLKQMGQLPFDPPNVRGWIGGRAWINSSTLATRRLLIETVLHPFNRAALNADEQMALDAEQPAHPPLYSVPAELMQQWGKLPPAEAADVLLARSLPGQRGTALAQQLATYLADGRSRPAVSVRSALATLLESPAYQLC